MNFVLDGMLGKLARWLRMLGHDTNYSAEMTDTELIDTAKKENRVLLTRDFALYQHAITKGIQAYYVEGKTEPERLSEIADRFDIALSINLEISRCPKCNTKIKPIAKEKIADKVEKNTLIHYNEFWVCPNCGAVYWQGAHWTKIYATLEEAKKFEK